MQKTKSMKLKLLFVLFLFTFSISAQQNSKLSTKPKLLVGIIVDQMRDDFLYRYTSKYSSGGFKRLMNEGFNCRNNQYHYASTVTGPGHAHVYNGSSPALSGIVGNEWYDKILKKTMYVASDSTVSTVGDGTAMAGKMSPRNMKVTTISDQIRIASQFKSKTVGIAIKDRGAILPAGHTGMAYWFDSAKGNWITSNFYTDKLPAWVNNFNDKKYPELYVKQPWNTLLPINQYTESEADDQAYEANISGETKAVFPHKVTLGSLASTYYGNELTKNFALAALDGEKLGQNGETDVLAISFSSPDYAGHMFGPQSVELEDIYLRLDKNIEEILNKLDLTLGKGNYTVFLTADHGVAEIPAFLKKNKVPAGVFLAGELEKKVEAILAQKFGEDNYILRSDNYQLYLNHDVLEAKKISLDEISKILRQKITQEEGVYELINLAEGKYETLPLLTQKKFSGLYNPKRSGELMLILEPSWFAGNIKGTTHGSSHAYDTHVPLLFFGNGIKQGNTTKPTFISDIAPTLSILLKILEPNGSIGEVISEALK